MSPQRFQDWRGMKHMPPRITAPKSLALGLILAVNGLAQIGPIGSNPNPDPGSTILGFETVQGWIVKSSSPMTSVSATTVRTQGGHALALGNPPNGATLTSQAVALTTPALAHITDAGAVFAVDVMPPASGSTGSLSLSFITPSSSSSGLTSVTGIKETVLGEAQLTGLHPGIYTTVKFPITESSRAALASVTASVKSLAFAFTLNLPATASSQFQFDNLRVIFAPLTTATLGTTIPANFGGSLNLVATGDTPTTQTFLIGPVQVPENFRLAQGTAGTTTVKLSLGSDGAAAFTCTYAADTSDQTGQSYQLTSCTGGVNAGDLVAANFVELAIVDGSGQMQIQADLAKNPVGDVVGSGIIPAMPTYWGKPDTCVPAPQTGKAFTVTTNCTAQTGEASQIVTGYFNKVGSSNVPANWIVTPVADRAVRHGTGMGNPAPPSPPATQASDFPFNQSGHANPGGDFDAYWSLTGDFKTTDNPTSGNASAHFDAELSGHLVVFGGDVDVMDAKAVVDTTSGSSPSSTGSVTLFVFGTQIPGGGSVNASTGFNFNLSAQPDFDLPTINYWIFTLTVGATANASLNTAGTLAASGFSLTVDPTIKMGVHISGGVNLGIASGEVDAKIDLLDVEAPLTAQAGLAVDTDPSSCSININFGASAKVIVSALGGEIDLVGSIGPCPFCASDSYTLVKWDPIESTTQTLFSIGPDTLSAIPLPISLCTKPIPAAVTLPSTTAQVGITYPLVATVNTPNVNCNGYTWSVTPSETITGTGCASMIQFAHTGPHTITVNIAETTVDSNHRTIPITGSGSATINVSTLAPGLYITGTLGSFSTTNQAPFNGQTVQLLATEFIQITGELAGSTETLKSVWTLTDGANHTVTLPSQDSANGHSVATWSLPVPGTYTVKMSMSDSSGLTESTSMTAVVNPVNTRQP